jgi:integrase-like protein
VVPFFDSHEIPLSRVLTDRGTKYCGSPDRHEYELYLAIENIDHTRTKGKSPQTNGICERFHKTMLNECYRVAFRKKIYPSLEELQADLELWLREYHEERPHQGRWCFGKRRSKPSWTVLLGEREAPCRVRSIGLCREI